LVRAVVGLLDQWWGWGWVSGSGGGVAIELIKKAYFSPPFKLALSGSQCFAIYKAKKIPLK
jgi:hypothetical protein